ncbi:hypothetical protein D3C76_1829200 [compost metagenome]
MQQRRLAFLHNVHRAVEQACFDRVLQHYQSAGFLLLGNEKPGTQRAHFTFSGAHA